MLAVDIFSRSILLPVYHYLCWLFSIAYAAHNQYRVVTSGGLDTLVSALHGMMNKLYEQNNKDYIDSAVALINTLDTVISDNGRCTANEYTLLMLF